MVAFRQAKLFQKPTAFTKKTVPMKTFVFETTVDAVVRVLAADEDSARKVVPTVLGAPGTIEIALANEANTATGQHARVTDVSFSIASLALGEADSSRKDPSTPTLAVRSRRK
jgi:hypothetical protein